MRKSLFDKIPKWSDFFLPQGKKNSFFVKNKFPMQFETFTDSYSDFDMFSQDNFKSNDDEVFSPVYKHLAYNIYHDSFEDDDD